MKKFLTYTLVAVAIISFFGITAITVQADTNNRYSSIIQKLVDKFNLNSEEVQRVFDEARQEKQQEMQSRFNGSLIKGRIQELTDEQKQALTAKKEEMKQKFEAMKDLTLEERQIKMKEMQDETKAWAEENGINQNLMIPGMGGGRFGKGFGRGFSPSGDKQ